MTVEQFVDWAMAQPGGRYELLDGEVVAMAPERAAHARLKSEVWLALREGIKTAGLPCEALPDGMTVKIDARTAYEPDALVHCGEPLSDQTVIVPSPLIVGRGALAEDQLARRRGQARRLFPRPEHPPHLIARTDRPTVIHHRRGDADVIETRIITAGALDLEPPGITLDLARIYG
jgi:hypothetical protein